MQREKMVGDFMCSLFTTVAFANKKMVARRAGLFYREKILLPDIVRVVAVVKDALTHEEIVVVFSDKIRNRVWISEFDKNYSTVIEFLSFNLPGFISPDGLAGKNAFDRAERLLWEREK